MTKLHRSVAVALGLNVKLVDGLNVYGWRVEYEKGHWTPVELWIGDLRLAERLIDAYHMDLVWSGGRWAAAIQDKDGKVFWEVHEDRKTAALMAFCRFKGVAYE